MHPIPIPILLLHRQTCKTNKLRDILDNKPHKPPITHHRDDQRHKYKKRRVQGISLDDRRPPKQPRKIRIQRSNTIPHPHPIPTRKRLTPQRHMRENHPPDLMRKLDSPRTQKRNQKRRVHNRGVVKSGVG